VADSRNQLEQTSSVVSLKMLLTHASERAGAVYAMDPREYARSMDEVRGIIGQLAEALELGERSRAWAASGEVNFRAPAVPLH
jgi:hypothetical protein